MKKLLLYIIIFMFTAGFLPAYAGQSSKELNGYIITKITIKRYNVFDLNDPDEQGFIPRAANSIHIITKEEIVRAELLFKKGDEFDNRIVDESERNLRKFRMLQRVLLTAIPNHEDKTVELLVETWDQWSLIIGGSFGGTSGNNQTGLDVGDINLLGTGQLVKYTMRKSNSNIAHSFGYKDSTFLSSRYLMDVGYSIDSKEKRWSGLLQLPFYSLDKSFSHGVTFTKTDHQELGLEFQNQTAEYFAAFGFPLAQHIVRVGGGVSGAEQYLVDQTLGRQPTTRNNQAFLTLSLLFNPREYMEATYLDKFKEVEDVPLGLAVYLRVGRNFTSAGASSNRESFSVSLSKYSQLFSRDVMFASITSRRNDTNFSDEYFYSKFRYYWRDFEKSTIVLNLEGGYVDSTTERFIIGGTNGIRGYEVDSFIGDRLILGNLEYRYFFKRTMMWGIFEPGIVLFGDSASTWNSSIAGEPKKVYSSFGIGIRIAFLKAPGISLLRIDYGIPTDNINKPVVTIGMEGFF